MQWVYENRNAIFRTSLHEIMNIPQFLWFLLGALMTDTTRQKGINEYKRELICDLDVCIPPLT